VTVQRSQFEIVSGHLMFMIRCKRLLIKLCSLSLHVSRAYRSTDFTSVLKMRTYLLAKSITISHNKCLPKTRSILTGLRLSSTVVSWLLSPTVTDLVQTYFTTDLILT
jgi:hypothetical protein